ncbi:hypothetical protein Trydic_g6993 [Trypoxylus dichotomus]
MCNSSETTAVCYVCAITLFLQPYPLTKLKSSRYDHLAEKNESCRGNVSDRSSYPFLGECPFQYINEIECAKDEIPNEALKNLILLVNLAITFSSARIISIPKPMKDSHPPESYRSISLLSTISKVLEILLLATISDHLDEHLHNGLFGFRSGLSVIL